MGTAARFGLTATWSAPWMTVMAAEDDLVVSEIEVAVRVTLALVGRLGGAL